jgi:predicted secreted hydrolase
MNTVRRLRWFSRVLWAAVVIVGCAVVLLVGATAAREGEARPENTSEWLSARPDYRWSFPADHWSHPGYKTEWWYVTGHLVSTTNPDRRFGFQFTFFRVGLSPQKPESRSRWATRDLVMGHASLSDLSRDRHVFSEVLYRAIPLLGGFGKAPDSTIVWSRGPAGTAALWTLLRTNDGFAFHAQDDARAMAFDLTVRPVKPHVFQGPNGYSRKGDSPSAASLYYSYTRLATTGSVRWGEETFTVSGTSWMDREIGSNQMDEDQVGWDWFSLQLADGRDLMLYLLRDREGGTDFGRGTLVDAEGNVRYLDRSAWRLQATETWRSKKSGIIYPVRWRLELPAERLDLEVRALLVAQENLSVRAGKLSYWEGAVEVRDAGAVAQDSPIGQGYVELTGYGEGNRPPI